MPPKVIGPYEILSILGSGGIGSVYRARDKRDGEEVALKLLSSGPALDAVAARRMAREFEALYELDHPNVVRVFDTGVYRGYPYLTMELVRGLTLREYLAVDSHFPVSSLASHSAGAGRPGRRATSMDPDEDVEPFGVERMVEETDTDESILEAGHVNERGPEALRRLADAIDEPFTEDEMNVPTIEVVSGAKAEPVAARAARIDLVELNRPERVSRLKDALLQICEALAYVHAHGMVHRDLKPSNIMVDDDRRVKLMDFGLAKFLAEESAVTAAGRIVGTYRYMAPEQLLGEPVDGRSDLYSLGAMLYELLAGRPAFDAKTPAEMWNQVLEREAPPVAQFNSAVDVHLARIALALIRKDADERLQTAEEVYQALLEG